MNYKRNPDIVMDEISAQMIASDRCDKAELIRLRKRLYHLSDFPMADKQLKRQGQMLAELASRIKRCDNG